MHVSLKMYTNHEREKRKASGQHNPARHRGQAFDAKTPSEKSTYIDPKVHKKLRGTCAIALAVARGPTPFRRSNRRGKKQSAPGARFVTADVKYTTYMLYNQLKVRGVSRNEALSAEEKCKLNFTPARPCFLNAPCPQLGPRILTRHISGQKSYMQG